MLQSLAVYNFAVIPETPQLNRTRHKTIRTNLGETLSVPVNMFRCVASCCIVLHRVASLQRVAVCCSLLQHAVACCSVFLRVLRTHVH